MLIQQQQLSLVVPLPSIFPECHILQKQDELFCFSWQTLPFSPREWREKPTKEHFQFVSPGEPFLSHAFLVQSCLSSVPMIPCLRHQQLAFPLPSLKI